MVFNLINDKICISKSILNLKEDIRIQIFFSLEILELSTVIG